MPRKAINLPSLVLLLLSLTCWGQNPAPKVVAAKENLSYEDFEHPNKGCPENSECDELMGKLLASWKKLTERWDSGVAAATKLAEMRKQLMQQGWPVEFLVKSQARSGLNPVLFGSACPEHNPKASPQDKIWRGLGFIKGTDKGHIVFSRGDTEFKIKQGELLQLRPVVVHSEGAAPRTFFIPLDETPAYLAQGKLWSLIESENIYVLIGAPLDGAWELALPPETGLSELFEDRSDVACPKDAKTAELPWFPKTHCQKLLDKDAGKEVVVQYFQSC